MPEYNDVGLAKKLLRKSDVYVEKKKLYPDIEVKPMPVNQVCPELSDHFDIPYSLVIQDSSCSYVGDPVDRSVVTDMFKSICPTNQYDVINIQEKVLTIDTRFDCRVPSDKIVDLDRTPVRFLEFVCLPRVVGDHGMLKFYGCLLLTVIYFMLFRNLVNDIIALICDSCLGASSIFFLYHDDFVVEAKRVLICPIWLTVLRQSIDINVERQVLICQVAARLRCFPALNIPNAIYTDILNGTREYFLQERFHHPNVYWVAKRATLF